MSRRYYGLPPFTTLAVFEAAARHLSFKNAAQELSVTPGAVSHQIKALEGEIGVLLFERQHRGVQLTIEGTALFETLASTFRQISRQLAHIRKSGDADAVLVGSTTAVAAFWLSPAIISFWRDFPEIKVNQVTQDHPFQNARDFDFVISYGPTHDLSLDQAPLYRDELVPVASDELAVRLQSLSVAELAQERLIHLDTANSSWTSWREWFGHFGYKGDIAYGRRVTSYSVALQIACKGAGVALGWHRLVQPMIESGKLTIVNTQSMPAPHQFYLVGLPDAKLSAGARALKDWILEEVAKRTI